MSVSEEERAQEADSLMIERYCGYEYTYVKELYAFKIHIIYLFNNI